MKIEQYSELFFIYYLVAAIIKLLLFLYPFSLFIIWDILLIKVNSVCHTHIVSKYCFSVSREQIRTYNIFCPNTITTFNEIAVLI